MAKSESHISATMIERAGRKLHRLLGVGVPRVGRVRWGDLARSEPISRQFGYDRGGPVDRYYIERFLEEHSEDVHGHVLEVKDSGYTRRFGSDRVRTSDVLDIDPDNPKATLIVNLNDAGNLPDNTFDCIILTQTLQLVFDLDKALADLHRSLNSGGVLLLTVPAITPVRTQTMSWYWSFTDIAISRLLHAHFSPAEVEVLAFGNVRAATAFLYGLGATELTRDQLDHVDPNCQLVVVARAVKAGI